MRYKHKPKNPLLLSFTSFFRIDVILQYGRMYWFLYIYIYIGFIALIFRSSLFYLSLKLSRGDNLLKSFDCFVQNDRHAKAMGKPTKAKMMDLGVLKIHQDWKKTHTHSINK